MQVLGEGRTDGINDSAGAAETKLVLTNAKFWLSLHCNGDEI